MAWYPWITGKRLIARYKLATSEPQIPQYLIFNNASPLREQESRLPAFLFGRVHHKMTFIISIDLSPCFLFNYRDPLNQVAKLLRFS